MNLKNIILFFFILPLCSCKNRVDKYFGHWVCINKLKQPISGFSICETGEPFITQFDMAVHYILSFDDKTKESVYVHLYSTSDDLFTQINDKDIVINYNSKNGHLIFTPKSNTHFQIEFEKLN